mgnify:CR=1 FL=1
MKLLPIAIFLFFSFSLTAQIDEEDWLEKGLTEIPFIQQFDLSKARDMVTEQNIKNLLMPPRKQVNQNASMYYALAGALEFYVNLEGNYKINLSPEFIKFNLPLDKQNLKEAIKFLKETGTISAGLLPYDSKRMNSAIYQAERYRISNYLSLFKFDFQARHKVFAIKKALLRGNPVIATIRVNAEFQALNNESRYWEIEEGDTTDKGLQTLLIVGFDENKEAFELMNFQGSEWGYRGCIWVDYEEFSEVAQEGMVLIPVHLEAN